MITVIILFALGIGLFSYIIINKQKKPEIITEVDVMPSSNMDEAENCLSWKNHFPEDLRFNLTYKEHLPVFFVVHKKNDTKTLSDLHQEMLSMGYFPAPPAYLLSAVERIHHDKEIIDEAFVSYNISSMHDEMIHERHEYLGSEGEARLRVMISTDGNIKEYDMEKDVYCLLGYIKTKDFSTYTSHN